MRQSAFETKDARSDRRIASDAEPRSRNRVLTRLWPYCLRERFLLGTSFAALVTHTLLRLLEPWPLKFIFDEVILPRNDRTPPSFLPDTTGVDPMLLVAFSAAAVVAISGLRALAQYVNQVNFAKIGNRVLARVRADVFRHLQGLSLSFHSSARSGDLILRVIQDVNLLRDAAVTAILPLFASSLLLIGMWAAMFWMQWKLALAATAIVPLIWLRTRSLAGKIREAGVKQRKRQGKLAATASESVGAIKNVQAFSLEGMFLDAFESSNVMGEKYDVRGAKLTASLGRSVDLVLAIATAAVLLYGTRLVLTSELSPGELLVFLTYLRRAFNPAQDFAKYTGRVAKACAAGERVFELLDREPEVRDLPGAIAAPRFAGSVRFEDVGFAYGPGPQVLRRMSFAIEPGQRVALVGPSGIGKSTVVNLLLRFYDPTFGRVLIDGRDIREFRVGSLRSQISVVLQDSILFAASLGDNIAYGAPGCSREEIEAAARLANVHEFVSNLPGGYEAILGERGVNLSGGQRQRIAIARAAVRKSPILVLDEPTTGLDDENRRSVLEALERLAIGRTVLIIAHDLRLSMRADAIFYLHDGQVVEKGTHEELVARGGRYAALCRLRSEDGRQEAVSNV
ncbi:MAG TPA: ABC transporter ATP-binding protein [Vicinamibacteria bacterium]|nr:ABC transporter ATP-binding protein [Vicinamibacteria bacterium]